MASNIRILVTGASGNVGHHVVHNLAQMGAIEVCALVRNVDNPVVAAFPKTVEVFQGNLGEPEALRAALEGVQRVFLFGPFEHPEKFIELAKQMGVKRIVAFSSIMPLVEIEEPVEKSGLEWTHVRPGEFMLNTIDYWGASIRELAVPIHEADIAAVSTVALTSDKWIGKALTLSGPQQLTPPQQVQAISEGIKKPVQYIALSPEEGRESLIAVGYPEDIADYVLGYYKGYAVSPGEILNTVEEVTGRPGRTMAQWAADHVADFTSPQQ